MKKIGYTCGVYDLFHVGHLNLFERCKKECDYLIVGVCDDEYVRNIKNKEAVINENDRARIVAALKCVDEVHIIDTETTIDKVKAYKEFGYNVLFVGDDWKNTERFIATEKEFKENNLPIDIVFFPYTKEISTSKIRERMNS
ncbi:MAG: adenylyltransferase/cytidyltransferase family protein [Clostridia bacterium]|nr:adenylyltransferase/cytidyltransferase family protein [Clostridia bacterium]